MAKLRAVTPGETAPKKRKLTVVQAVTRGTYEELLEALRLRVAEAIQSPSAHPRDLPPLARQLVLISRELEAATIAGSDDDVVGLAARTPDEEWSAV